MRGSKSHAWMGGAPTSFLTSSIATSSSDASVLILWVHRSLDRLALAARTNQGTTRKQPTITPPRTAKAAPAESSDSSHPTTTAKTRPNKRRCWPGASAPGPSFSTTALCCEILRYFRTCSLSSFTGTADTSERSIWSQGTENRSRERPALRSDSFAALRTTSSSFRLSAARRSWAALTFFSTLATTCRSLRESSMALRSRTTTPSVSSTRVLAFRCSFFNFSRRPRGSRGNLFNSSLGPARSERSLIRDSRLLMGSSSCRRCPSSSTFGRSRWMMIRYSSASRVRSAICDSACRSKSRKFSKCCCGSAGSPSNSSLGPARSRSSVIRDSRLLTGSSTSRRCSNSSTFGRSRSMILRYSSASRERSAICDPACRSELRRFSRCCRGSRGSPSNFAIGPARTRRRSIPESLFLTGSRTVKRWFFTVCRSRSRCRSSSSALPFTLAFANSDTFSLRS